MTVYDSKDPDDMEPGLPRVKAAIRKQTNRRDALLNAIVTGALAGGRVTIDGLKNAITRRELVGLAEDMVAEVELWDARGET